MDEIKLYECSQCGGTEFEPAGSAQVTCSHCHSLYRVLRDEPRVTILKGANVVLGRSANVEIHGDVEIQPGADVNIEGRVLLVKGKQKRVFNLELVRKGDRQA